MIERISEIDVGDEVFHRPTGETWVVALVRGDDLYWCGYPFGGYASAADCDMKRPATDDYREAILRRLVDAAGNEAPIFEARKRLGKV